MRGEAAHIAIDIDAVERIAALGWRGLEEQRLGAWLLRAAGGFTGRSNSALLQGTPSRGSDGCLDELDGIVRWYADRGLPPMAQVPLTGADGIDNLLAAAGWRAHDLVRFLTGDIAALRRPDRSEASTRLDAEPDAAWLSTYHYRGAVLPAHARQVIQRAGPETQLCFGSLRESGSDPGVLAVARGALARGWLGVTAVTVAAGHRRRGHATRLMDELAAWATQRGAHSIYLQVAADNRPALHLYEKLGFHHHHDYRYRVAPDRPTRFS